MVELEAFMDGWTDAFVAAEADGREVELFAAVLGADVPVRPEWACVGLHGVGAGWVQGEPRYVPSWQAWPVLCVGCAGIHGAA
jgi:hypothetical protein